MMKMDEGTVQLLINGWTAARAFQCQTMGSEFLLFGASSCGSKAGEFLNDAGADTESIAEKISELLNVEPLGTDFAPATIDDVFRYSRQDTKKIIVEADQIAKNTTESGKILPEHILRIMLAREQFAPYKMLKAIGVDIQSLIQVVDEYLSDLSDDGSLISSNDSEKNDLEDSMDNDDLGLGVKSNKSKTKNGSKKHKTLEQFGKNLTELAKQGKIDPVVGREEEINRVMQVLARRTKNNPCLVGEPGVGKTAIAEGLALKISEGDVPEILLGKSVYNVDMGSMIAGSKYRGDFEERIKKVLEEAMSDDSVILFIDEIHTIIGTGAGDGSLDAANIMKPMLTKGELQIIGATTLDEYSKIIEKDAALERRFQKVMVEEPSQADAILILKGLRPRYEAHHKIKITDEAIEQAVKLSSRYLTDRYLPDKAIDLIDEASAKKRINFVDENNMHSLKLKLDEVVHLKKAAADNMEFEKAQSLYNEEQSLTAKIEELKSKNAPDKDGFTGVLTVDDIAEVLAKWSGIPVAKITESDTEKLKGLEDELKKRVIGQDEAVTAIAKAIRRSRLGLKDPNRPSGSFIFLGTTGVGKTELARALADVMFGDENSLIRIDMSEYMEKHDVSKLIGSPPGYVGYDEGGQLTEKIRRHPYSVVLFDEIEKAHPDIFNSMLQILDDGRLTDGKGRLVDFKNTIIIMTSNIGARMLTSEAGRRIGFDLASSDDKDEASREKLYGGKNYDDAKAVVLEELKKSFSPEFINRVDDIIFFRMLGRDSILKIVDLLVTKVGKRINDLGITITLTDEAKLLLAKKGYDPQYGARPLKRVIQAMVEDKFSEAMLDGVVKPGCSALVDAKDDEIIITSQN